MQATVRAARRGRNAPREEVPRPPTGGRPSSAGTTTGLRAGATLDFVSVYTTAADRRSPRLAALDAAIAVAAFTATLLVAAHGSAFAPEPRPVDLLTVALAALATLPLAVWRRSPLGVFALTTVASAVFFFAGSAPGPPFGPTIALSLLAASPHDRPR